VLEGALADACQVADSFGALHWVDARAAGLHRSALRSIDATRPVVELRFDGVEAQPLPGAGKATLARLRDAAYVILAADTLGAGWTPAPSRAPPPSDSVSATPITASRGSHAACCSTLPASRSAIGASTAVPTLVNAAGDLITGVR
jgi:hypothetical protein